MHCSTCRSHADVNSHHNYRIIDASGSLCLSLCYVGTPLLRGGDVLASPYPRGGRLLAFRRDSPPPVEVGRRPPGGGEGGGVAYQNRGDVPPVSVPRSTGTGDRTRDGWIGARTAWNSQLTDSLEFTTHGQPGIHNSRTAVQLPDTAHIPSSHKERSRATAQAQRFVGADLATANMARTSFSPSPTHLDVRELAEMLKKVLSH